MAQGLLYRQPCRRIIAKTRRSTRNELDVEIEPALDDDMVEYTQERVMEFDEDVEDIDLDSLTALEGPDFF